MTIEDRYSPSALNTYRRIKNLELELWKLHDLLGYNIRRMSIKEYLHFYQLSKEIEDNHRDELDRLEENKWRRISKAKGG
jgi:hypothetical protein